MAKLIKFNIRLNVDGKEQLVTTTADVKELRKSMASLKGTYGSLADEALKFNQSLQAIKNLSDVLNSLTAESRSFSAAMKAANTMAGKGGEDFERLKGQVAELGKTVPMARDQLANGLYQVISNGVPEDNWISYLEASARSAVGGIADVGEVVKVTSTVIKNYGLEWSAAQDIQDKIQLTAKNGVTSFEQLAAALPSVTGQAAQLGVSFTEMLAVMGTLTGVTGNTSEVATQLASVLTALTKESSNSQKMAEKMGISFNAASVKAAGGLQNYLQQLDQTITAYSAKTGELKESIYSKLFGRAEALRLTTALTGELSGKFAENINALENSAGTIDKAFETMASTGSATVQMMKNQYAAVTDLIAGITSGVQPFLTFSSYLGTTALSVMSLTKAFKEAHIAQKAMILSTTAGNVILKSFTATVKSLGAACGTASKAVKGLMSASVIGLVIAGVVTAVEKIIERLEEAKNKTDAVSRVNQRANELYSEQSARVRTLIGIIQDENTANSLRKKYIEELKGIIPGYNGMLSEEGKLINDNREAIDDYLTSLERKIKLQAAEEELTELYKRQRQELKKLREEQEVESKAKSAYNTATAAAGINASMLSTPGTQMLSRGLDIDTQRTKSSYRVAAKAVEERKEAISRIDAAIEEVQKEIADGSRTVQATADATAANASGTVQPPASGDESEKGRKKRVNAELEAVDTAHLQEQNRLLRLYNEGKLQDEKEYNALLFDLEQQTIDKRLAIAGLEPKKRAEIEKQKLENIRKYNDECKKEEEEAAKKEAKTYLQTLQEALAAAQKDFGNAVTVEARIKAAAEADKIQAEIDRLTQGELTVKADVEPSYIQKGSIQDKRQSYSNARSRASRVQSDFDSGLIDRKQAEEQIAAINKELEKIGGNVKPVELEVRAKGLDAFKSAFGSVQAVAGSVQAVTEALEGNGTAWEKTTAAVSGFFQIADGIRQAAELVNMLAAATEQNTASTVASTAATEVSTAVTAADTAAAISNTSAKSGEAIAGATASGAKMPFPYNLIAIAAGIAAVVAALSMIGSFSTGGIVGGSSPAGDKMLARVNSGEMILNRRQQQNLLKMLSGVQAFASGGIVSSPTLALMGEYAGAGSNPEVIAPLDKLRSMLEPAGFEGGTVRFEIEGRKLVGIIEKEYNIRKRS